MAFGIGSLKLNRSNGWKIITSNKRYRTMIAFEVVFFSCLLIAAAIEHAVS